MTEPLLPASSPDEHALDPAVPAEPAGRRRTALWTAVVVLLVLLIGGGAFAAYSVLSGGGPRPTDVLPASTVAVLSVDLDPAAGQKVAAFRALRKVPELKKRLTSADDDLRRLLVDGLTDSGTCAGLDYDRDVKPWLGKRAAVAAVDLGDDLPSWALVLQVTDKDKAAAGYRKFVDCTEVGDDEVGYALGDDYLIASDSNAHAAKILADGKSKSLADDATYAKWTGAAGGKGVVSFYVAPRATDVAVTELDKFEKQLTGIGSAFGGSGFDPDSFDPESFDPESFDPSTFDPESFDPDQLDLDGGSGASGRGSMAAPAAEEKCDPAAASPFASVKKALGSFRGLAGVVRFSGSGLEVSVVSGGTKKVTSESTIGTQVGSLPRGTAVAGGTGVAPDYFSELAQQTDGCSAPLGDPASMIESLTGLTFPEDLQTLLGSGVTVSASGGQPAGTALADIPFGLTLRGDATKIKALIAKVETSTGLNLADVPVKVNSSADKVTLSNSPDYGKSLLSAGDLGSSDLFKDVVPNASRAHSLFFVDFAGIRDVLLTEAGRSGASAADLAKLRDYTTPLRALGLSTWSSGDEGHFLLKITTS